MARRKAPIAKRAPTGGCARGQIETSGRSAPRLRGAPANLRGTAARQAAAPKPRRRRAAAAAVGGDCEHRVLQLLEGARLDLAHALARDAVDLAQVLERLGLLVEPALGQDVALALVERLEALGQQAAPPGELARLGDHALLVLVLRDQRVRHSRSPSPESGVASEWSLAASRRFICTTSSSVTPSSSAISPTTAGGRSPSSSSPIGSSPTQVEEQLLLGRGRAHLHQRAVVQHVLLDGGRIHHIA